MKALAALILALLLSGCATKVERAALADNGTTIGALLLGATELNPVGVATVPLKYAIIEHNKTLPDGERQYNEAAMTSFWGGLGVNNACVILAIVTHGVFAPMCFIPGIVYATTTWKSSENERLFWYMCAEEKRINANLVCEFKGQ